MKQLTLSLIFCALSAAACAAGAPAGRDYAFGMDDGCDSMRVRIAFHSPTSGLMEIYPASTNDVIGVWVKGNGSFGRVLLEIHTSQGLIRVNGFPDRAFVCFDGWRLLRAKMPKIRPDKSGKTWFDPAAFYFTTYRKALNPRDMVPVDTNLRVGDVIGIRTGASLPAAPKEKAYDAMDYVGEKDL